MSAILNDELVTPRTSKRPNPVFRPAPMAGENFCLRWNEFEANLGGVFRDLRTHLDFSDVTLACKGHQVRIVEDPSSQIFSSGEGAQSGPLCLFPIFPGGSQSKPSSPSPALSTECQADRLAGSIGLYVPWGGAGCPGESRLFSCCCRGFGSEGIDEEEQPKRTAKCGGASFGKKTTTANIYFDTLAAFKCLAIGTGGTSSMLDQTRA